MGRPKTKFKTENLYLACSNLMVDSTSVDVIQGKFRSRVNCSSTVSNNQQTTTMMATRASPTKGFMSKTMAMHVRFESCYISLPSSAKQQRETTQLYVFWRTRAAMANFSCLSQELNAVIHIQPEKFLHRNKLSNVLTIILFGSI